MTDVNFTDNSQQVLSALERGTLLALKAIGMSAEGHAKEETPVDTGRLRNSITWATKEKEGDTFSYKNNEGKNYEDTIGNGIKENEVYIGTNVEYAEGIEFGTRRKAGAAHFLQDAVCNHSDEYKELAKNALESVE